jgi:hypothetical protein
MLHCCNSSWLQLLLRCFQPPNAAAVTFNLHSAAAGGLPVPNNSCHASLLAPGPCLCNIAALLLPLLQVLLFTCEEVHISFTQPGSSLPRRCKDYEKGRHDVQLVSTLDTDKRGSSASSMAASC